jgi:hypothetical protein
VHIPVLNREDAIGCLRQTFIMRNHEERDSGLTVYFAHHFEDFASRTAVKISCGLISENQPAAWANRQRKRGESRRSPAHCYPTTFAEFPNPEKALPGAEVTSALPVRGLM